MTIERSDLHDLKNHLAISIGMNELVIKIIQRDDVRTDFLKIIEKLEKSLSAQKKIQDYFDKINLRLNEQIE